MPEFTEELKAGLLGGNFVRLHNLDADALIARAQQDEFAARRTEYLTQPDPWQPKKDRMAARVAQPA